MNKSLFNIAFVFCSIFLLTGCLVITIKNSKSHRSEYLDTRCGNIVKWHLHLHGGFDKDTVLFVVGSTADTLLRINDVTTTGSGCTNVYLTGVKQDGSFKIYLHNMPSFNLVKEVAKFSRDSIIVDIIINNKVFKICESIKADNYFAIYYDSPTKSISGLTSKKCFGCQ